MHLCSEASMPVIWPPVKLCVCSRCFHNVEGLFEKPKTVVQVIVVHVSHPELQFTGEI
jgi:hypothetical protein